MGRDNVFFLHVSLVPYLALSGELKTKPTQHSVAALRQVGIQPDAIVLRADRELPAEYQAQDLADVRRRHRGRRGRRRRAEHLRHPQGAALAKGSTPTSSAASACPSATSTGPTGTSCCDRVHDPEHDVEVALVGKYIDLPDAYLSVTEAMRAGGFHHDAKVSIRWVAERRVPDRGRAQKSLGGVDAIVVPGGFGVRGIEGKLGALKWAREKGVPTLGLCLGLQCMVIEYARNVAGIADASSTEFDPGRPRTRSSPRWRSRRPSSTAPVTSAARCGWGPTRPRWPKARSSPASTGPVGPRASPPPLRGQQRLPGPARGSRAASSPARRPTAAWSSSSSCRPTCTPTTSPPRPTRSSSPARPRAPAFRRAGRGRHRRAEGLASGRGGEAEGTTSPPRSDA